MLLLLDMKCLKIEIMKFLCQCMRSPFSQHLLFVLLFRSYNSTRIIRYKLLEVGMLPTKVDYI